MISELSAVLTVLMFFTCEVFADKCTLVNGHDGYCRFPEDCPGISETQECAHFPGRICCPDSGKSYQKCMEYGRFVYKQDYGAALLLRKIPQNISECHIDAVPLVVGGNRTVPKEFPHMVAVGFGPDLAAASWMCGGTLISEEFVLTAAHCSNSRDRGPATWARTGDINLQKTEDEVNVQEFKIIERIIHPGYKPPSRYNDIALFKLSSPVEPDGFTRPACLNIYPQEFNIREAVATGWGKLDYAASEGSPNLMKVVLSLIKYEDCNETFKADIGGRSLNEGVRESQLCAGELQGGKDTCQGDSGGPLQVVLDTPYCMYSVLGITSFGKFCGFKNSPAIYTRVFHFVPWIESIVWP